MDDLISRQAAIDAVKCGALSAAMVYGRTDEGSTALYETVKAIKALPSAQPEIVRCKDCKHKHIENMVWTCPFGLPGGPDFYCGYGAERRTDEQIDIR